MNHRPTKQLGHHFFLPMKIRLNWLSPTYSLSTFLIFFY